MIPFSNWFFIYLSVFIFLIGLLFGSFINVLIYRLPIGESVIYPPSSCTSCGNRIKFYDNIPVLSYVILKGKCRTCGSKISPMYPLIEFLTAMLIYALFFKFFYKSFFVYEISRFDISLFKGYLLNQLFYFIAYFVFLIILIPVFFIDFFNQIIPNSLNVFLIVLGFIFNIFLFGKSFWFPLGGFLAGGLFFYFIAISYEKLRKKEGLGGGDIKLIAGIGAFIGIKGVIFTIFAGSVLALIGFLFLAILKNPAQPASETTEGRISPRISVRDKKIPFGPFLTMAAVLYIFYGRHIVGAYINLIKK